MSKILKFQKASRRKKKNNLNQCNDTCIKVLKTKIALYRIPEVHYLDIYRI